MASALADAYTVQAQKVVGQGLAGSHIFCMAILSHGHSFPTLHEFA